MGQPKGQFGSPPAGKQVATLAGGCFWCIEAVFDELKGVESVESGYSGGTVANPSYQLVCTGTTGHAEAARITFDPMVISFKQILQVFFTVHDPTTLNRQGADVGTQYRSVIFTADDAQRDAAEKSKKKIQAKYRDPVVTEVKPLEKFWKAEDYHQNYYNAQSSEGYCRMVISPKLKKLKLE
jgi:peptide-methionine (S)-S-oxide reductase